MGYKAIWANQTPYSKFLVTVGILLISAVFFTFLATLIASLVFNLSMEDLNTILNDFSNPRALPVLKIIQTVTTLGTFILPAFLLGWLFGGRPVEYLKLDRAPGLFSVMLVMVAIISAVPLINYLGELNSYMKLPGILTDLEHWMREKEDQAATLTKLFLDMDSVSSLFINLFMIALLPAIGEELIFRGLVQRIFSEWFRNKHAGIWVSAFLFSCMHLQFYGFIPRLLLGALLGYLFVWSGSLLLPMLAHFMNNALAVIFTYLMSHQMTSVDADTIGTGEGQIPLLLVTSVLTITLLAMIKKIETKRRLQSVE